MALQTGGLAAEQYYKIDQGWLHRSSRGIAGTLLGKPSWGVLILPPLRGPVGKAQAHTTAEKVEVSKVQLLVSEHMFGQVVMRVYNGNLGDSRIIP